MAIESEDDLKDFYNVWFEYLIRTEFFHFAVYEDDCLRNGVGFSKKYLYEDDEYRDPYSRKMLMFLNKYDRWWLDRILGDWDFNEFWRDNCDYFNDMFNSCKPCSSRYRAISRFSLPSLGRSWGKAISNRYKTKLNHYVMSRQFSPGQIFKGQMRRANWVPSDSADCRKLAKELLCLPFPSDSLKKYQEWDIDFLAPVLSPFEHRAKYGDSNIYDKQRECLKKDIAFVSRVFRDVESGWFPSSPR